MQFNEKRVEVSPAVSEVCLKYSGGRVTPAISRICGRLTDTASNLTGKYPIQLILPKML